MKNGYGFLMGMGGNDMPKILYVPEIYCVQGKTSIKVDMAYGPFTRERLMEFIEAKFRESVDYGSDTFKEIRIRVKKV